MITRPPRWCSSTALLACLALQGCALDFDRFVRSTAADASSPTDTGALPPMDVPTTDTSVPPADRPTTPPCPLPWLAATVENVSGSAGGGRVVRISLPSGERCSDLGMGVLPAQPMALTQLPTGEIAVASREELTLFDRASGSLARSLPWSDGLPLDAFPIQHGTTSAVAVAMRWSGSAGEEVGEVRVSDGRTMLATWSRSNFPISITSMTAHPTRPEQYLGLRSEGRTLALTPTTSGMHTSAEFADERAGLESIQTLVTPTSRHVAWTWRLSGQSPRVLLANPSATTTRLTFANNRVLGCIAPDCTRFLRAVTDPRDSDLAFALCEVSGSGLVRHVVAIGVTSNCLVLDGSTLGSNTRLSHLAVITR